MSARTEVATIVTGTTGEGTVLVCVRSVGGGLASDCGGGHDSCGGCSGLCSLGRRGHRQPICWRERQERALLCRLIELLASALSATLLAGAKGEGAALAFCSFGGRGLKTASVLLGVTGEVSALAFVPSVGVV